MLSGCCAVLLRPLYSLLRSTGCVAQGTPPKEEEVEGVPAQDLVRSRDSPPGRRLRRFWDLGLLPRARVPPGSPGAGVWWCGREPDRRRETDVGRTAKGGRSLRGAILRLQPGGRVHLHRAGGRAFGRVPAVDKRRAHHRRRGDARGGVHPVLRADTRPDDPRRTDQVRGGGRGAGGGARLGLLEVHPLQGRAGLMEFGPVTAGAQEGSEPRSSRWRWWFGGSETFAPLTRNDSYEGR